MLEEYTVEREGDQNIVGSIFKGRVKNIEHGLKAMFVDIGFDKNAFLHFWDAIPAALDAGLEEIQREGSKKKTTEEDHLEGHPGHLSGRLGDHRPGHQGPHRHQGPARHHQHLARRPLPRAHALHRPVRHLAQDRGSQGARPPAQDPPEALRPGRHGHHHAHRRPGHPRPPLRPRPRHAARTMGRDRGPPRRQPRARLRLPGTRPHRAHRARLPHRGSRPGASATTPRPPR